MRLRRAGSVILLVLIGLSTCVRADDTVIARNLAEQLRASKTANALDGFRIGVKVENGIVWMKGQVNNESQREHALNLARRVDGVKLVVNDLTIPGEPAQETAAAPVRQVTNNAPIMEAPPVERAIAPTRQAVTQRIPAATPGRAAHATRAGGPVPVGHGPRRVRPVQYSEGCLNGGCAAGSYGSGMGTPMVDSSYYGGGESYSDGGYSDMGPAGGGMSYESPQLPGHAWPSYASYPNYGAVTYPKQYSPSAWPYIGPFYPYPQVPMGWRKVSLEWDDGWWFLDFKSK